MDGWMTGVGWRETECLLIVFSLWTYCVGVVATTAVYAYGVCECVFRNGSNAGPSACVLSGRWVVNGSWVLHQPFPMDPLLPPTGPESVCACVSVRACVCVCVPHPDLSHTPHTPLCYTLWNRAVRLPVKTIINTKYRIFRNWLAACLFSPYVVHKL